MDLKLFNTIDFNQQFLRTLGKTTVNFAEVGECFAIAENIEDGNFDSWNQSWFAFAERLEEKARKCLGKGHIVSARHLFFRASEYYRQSTFYHRMDLDCTELQEGYKRHHDTLVNGFSLSDYDLETFTLDYGNKKLHCLKIINPVRERPLPTIIAPSGYDSTAEEMVPTIGIPALQRGYNLLLFDGPGQGNTLYDPSNRLFMTPDYGDVLNAVVNHAMDAGEFDSKRLVVVGVSFGGFLVTKAVASENRISAIILDPGQYDMGKAIDRMLPKQLKDMLSQDTKESEEIFSSLATDINRKLLFYPRMAAHGIKSIREYLNAMYDYRVSSDELKNIKCHVLVCDNESDTVSTRQGKELFDMLECPKTYIEFSAEDGAAGHCEATARQVFAQRAFDWLDEILNKPGSAE